MRQVVRAHERQTAGTGLFRLRIVRPGRGLAEAGDDAFGPLARIDHAALGAGALVRMHEHRDDEILSYVWRGSLVHADSAGHRVTVSARRLMLMNAGCGVRHEESVPDDPVEMLQIVIRPREAGLAPRVQFHEPPAPAPRDGTWRLLAGPVGRGAPLVVRQEVSVLDAHPAPGTALAALPAGHDVFVYVLDGVVAGEGLYLAKGDGIRLTGEPLPPLHAEVPSVLVAFLVDREAAATRAGTLSGP